MQKIFNAIKACGGKSYLVGGAVRDSFLGKKPKDHDYLVTGVDKERLMDLLADFGPVVLAGKSFGSIKLRLDGETIDFAVPRTEVSTGVGHKEFLVTCDPSLPVEADLGRRDFTVNSISRDMETGKLIDPFGGVQDLKDKVLRLVFDRAIEEDALRAMRAVQFYARFDLAIHPDLMASLKRNAHLVATVAPQRIAEEFCKLMTAPKPSKGILLMQETGILKYVMPELLDLVGCPQPAKYHAYDVFGHVLAAMDAVAGKGKRLVALRLTALLHDIGKPGTLKFKDDHTPQFLGHEDLGAAIAERILRRLNFSAVEDYKIPVDRIVHLVKNHMFSCDFCSTPKSMRKFVAHIGKDFVFDQIRLRIADRLGKGLGIDVSEWVTFARKIRTLGHGSKTAFNVKDLAINGTDVMASLGIKPGKAVGTILNALFQVVLDDPAKNSRDILLALAAEVNV